jgi:2-amino-4-hydroxy-6-hydroxymethyldihydropteridine diphosphokinase
VKKIAYLSLGSNLGDRRANLRNAIGKLLNLGRLVAASSFYETEPVEFTDQPWFLNCAVALQTDLSAEDFLAEIMTIEREMGRQRTRPKGPRTVDIDILLFGKAVLTTAQLTLPHPAMHQRRFVLEPLAEIAPDLQHPVLKKSARELLARLPKTGATVKKS